MSLQNIDTFEQDIAKELKKKEVNIRDVAQTSAAPGNAPVEPEKKSPLPIILSIIFLLLAGGGGIFGYMYYNQMMSPAQDVQQPQLPVAKTPTMLLGEISKVFADNIGMFVSSVTKTNDGYTFKLSSFSPVYAFILKNESTFSDDLAKSLGVAHAVRGDILPQQPAPVFATTSATSTATTTVVKPKTTTNTTVVATTSATSTASTSATSTAPTTTPVIPEPEPAPLQEKDMTPIPFTFTDLTINNQNMRVGKSGENVMYYAFIENKAVVFSKTTEGILSLKNAILR